MSLAAADDDFDFTGYEAKQPSPTEISNDLGIERSDEELATTFGDLTRTQRMTGSKRLEIYDTRLNKELQKREGLGKYLEIIQKIPRYNYLDPELVADTLEIIDMKLDPKKEIPRLAGRRGVKYTAADMLRYYRFLKGRV